MHAFYVCVFVFSGVDILYLFHAGLKNLVPCPPLFASVQSPYSFLYMATNKRSWQYFIAEPYILTFTRADAVNTRGAVSPVPLKIAQDFDGFAYITLLRSVIGV